jgi:ABC-type uncharacterized transport system permease subunit
MQTLIQSLPLVIVIPLLAIMMNAEFTDNPTVVLSAIGLFILGWISAVAAGCLYALLALWFGKWGGIMGLLNGLQWVLGGLIAPSPFMPDSIAWIMRLSPFWLANGGAGELLSGTIQPQWWMAVVGIGWPVVLLVGFRFAWRGAMKRFEAVGI